MKVLVIGGTGGSGRAALQSLLDKGHEVTALARSPEKLGLTSPRLRTLRGDATNADDIDAAVRGQDAVVVTLGISENAFNVRLFGPSRTRIDVRSHGTRLVMNAMKRYGVKRLIVQTSYGVGPTKPTLDLVTKLFFSVVLGAQIEDTELQQAEVEASDLDWVIAQPVNLSDKEDTQAPFASTKGEIASSGGSRRSVGAFLAHAVTAGDLSRTSVALSRSV